MTGLYKLIFDLTAYYMLTGFYLNIFLDVPASASAFALLCLMIGMTQLARYKTMPAWCRRSCYLLPVLVLVFRPEVWSAVHMLPAWAYCVWCLETQRMAMDYSTFRDKFLFGLRLQLVCIPGLLLSNRGPDAAVTVLPYLLILLTVGVCCLRCLRQEGNGLRYGILAAVFLVACMGMTLGGVPAVLLKIFTWIYQEVFVRLLQAAGAVFLLVISFILKIIADFSNIKPTEKEEIVDTGMGTVQEMLGIQEQTEGMSQGSQIALIIGYVVVGLAVIVFLGWMVIRLLGSLDTHKPVATVYSAKEEVPELSAMRRKLRKPKDPRGKVRYYYGLFLRECKSRGMELQQGSTGEELAQQCVRYFPEADPAVLAAIYTPARYCNTQPVTEIQADMAAKAWNSLRKTKYKAIRQ